MEKRVVIAQVLYYMAVHDNTKGYQMACQSIWKPEWDEILLKMKELLAGTRKILSRRVTFNHRVWIWCFMAFHNLPRVFFSPAHQGIWKETFPPLDAAWVLQAASHFPLQG